MGSNQKFDVDGTRAAAEAHLEQSETNVGNSVASLLLDACAEVERLRAAHAQALLALADLVSGDLGARLRAERLLAFGDEPPVPGAVDDRGPPWTLYAQNDEPVAILPAMRPGTVCSARGLTMDEAMQIVDVANAAWRRRLERGLEERGIG